MVQLIIGEKGKGKTKQLLDKVNSEVKTAFGNIVYLDKSTKHMYELNNKIRLIDISEYMVSNSDEVVGFICGIISQDHDIETVYFDSFMEIGCQRDAALMEKVVEKLQKVSEKFGVGFILSASIDESSLPASLKGNVIISL